MLTKIVSSEWLNNNLDNPNLIILDASQNNNKADLNTNLKNTQIKGAHHFDIKGRFSDKKSKFPNTLLTPKEFEIEAKKLGINKSSEIVVYDNLGIYFSPRVWWMFKVMEHEKIAVLNGGLPEWIKKGYATEKTTPHNVPLGDFKSQFNHNKVKDFDFVKKNISTEKSLVIDVRSEGRFKALTPEPREGLRGGNIPKSINIPYQKVLENGTFKSKEDLAEIFTKMKVEDKNLVFSCGSGITACIVLLASELVIDNKKSVYDGSWTEWAQTFV